MQAPADSGAISRAEVIGLEDENRLFRTLRPAMLRWALALGTDPDAAEDLVQETLLAAHRNLPRFDPALGTLESWAAEILVRRLFVWRVALGDWLTRCYYARIPTRCLPTGREHRRRYAI